MTREVSFKARIWLVFPLEKGNYFVEEARESLPEAYTDHLMILYDHDVEQIQRLMSYQEADLRSSAKLKGTMIDRASHLWAMSRGKIYVGNNDQTEYEILAYDHEGNLLRKIRKEYSPLEVSDEYKRKILELYEENTNTIIQDIARRIFFPKYMPPYQSLFSDDEG